MKWVGLRLSVAQSQFACEQSKREVRESLRESWGGERERKDSIDVDLERDFWTIFIYL